MIVTNLVFQDIYTSKYALLYDTAFDKLKSHHKYQEFNTSILSDQYIKEKNIGTKKKIAYIFAGSARSFVCDKVIFMLIYRNIVCMLSFDIYSQGALVNKTPSD